MTTQTPPLIEK